MGLRILIFASSDCPEVYGAARHLAEVSKAQLVNKRSSKAADLLLVAEYGVVEPFAVLAVDASGVRARLTELVTPRHLAGLLDALNA